MRRKKKKKKKVSLSGAQAAKKTRGARRFAQISPSSSSSSSFSFSALGGRVRAAARVRQAEAPFPPLAHSLWYSSHARAGPKREGGRARRRPSRRRRRRERVPRPPLAPSICLSFSLGLPARALSRYPCLSARHPTYSVRPSVALLVVLLLVRPAIQADGLYGSLSPSGERRIPPASAFESRR